MEWPFIARAKSKLNGKRLKTLKQGFQFEKLDALITGGDTWKRSVSCVLDKIERMDEADMLRLRAILKTSTIEPYPKDHILIREGELFDGHVYLFLLGRLGIYRGDVFINYVVREGDVIGENALLTGQKRNATVIVEEPSALLKLEMERSDLVLLSLLSIASMYASMRRFRQTAQEAIRD